MCTPSFPLPILFVILLFANNRPITTASHQTEGGPTADPGHVCEILHAPPTAGGGKSNASAAAARINSVNWLSASEFISGSSDGSLLAWRHGDGLGWGVSATIRGAGLSAVTSISTMRDGEKGHLLACTAADSNVRVWRRSDGGSAGVDGGAAASQWVTLAENIDLKQHYGLAVAWTYLPGTQGEKRVFAPSLVNILNTTCA